MCLCLQPDAGSDSLDIYTICPKSSDPFYIVTYYIKWVTTSWTHSKIGGKPLRRYNHKEKIIYRVLGQDITLLGKRRLFDVCSV